MKVKIAAAQISFYEMIEDRFNYLLKLIPEIAKKGARFVCFPEISLIALEEDARDISKEISVISKSAKENNITVIFGSYIKNKEGIVRNQILVISNKGELIHKYNKKHIYLSESKFVKEGRNNKVLEVDGVRFAVINCWDYAYPEDIRNLARKGAKIIFCPSYLLSHPKTGEVLDKIPQVRAFDSMSYFVMVDACEDETFRKSKICHPLRMLANIEDKPGIIYAELDLSEIDHLRERLLNF